MLKALIVDDMPMSIIALQAELDDNFASVLEVVETATGVVDAARKLKDLEIDLIFLDIQMNDGDGFDLLDIINRKNIHIIFTTGSKKYALKAFQYAAVDYLLKPIDTEQLERALGKLSSGSGSQKNTSQISHLSLSTQESVRIVAFKNIVNLSAQGNYCEVFLSDGSKQLMSRPLKFYEEQLNDDFFRIHQSHLVNIAHVSELVKRDGAFIRMIDGRELPVSVRRRNEVLQWLTNKK